MGTKFSTLSIAVVWLLNLLCVVCTVSVLHNWDAVTWIVGSAGVGAVLEVIFVTSILFVLATGFCVLGSLKTIKSSYIQLRLSYMVRLTFSLAIPSGILFLFFCLACTAVQNTPAVNTAIGNHANHVFNKADINGDMVLSYYEFEKYSLSLNDYDEGDEEVHAKISTLFDSMDTDVDGYISQTDIFNGVMTALLPPRRSVGIGLFVICGIVVVYTCVFIMWYQFLSNRNYEEEYQFEQDEIRRMKEGSYRPMLDVEEGEYDLFADVEKGRFDEDEYDGQMDDEDGLDRGDDFQDDQDREVDDNEEYGIDLDNSGNEDDVDLYGDENEEDYHEQYVAA